jgi:formylglycine-generating enzyme required for sulfatase activity
MTKWLSVFGFIALAASAEPVLVTGGEYTPAILLDESVQTLVMADFKLDATPVTYAQYLEFVKANPKWQRANAAAIFHDGNYLISWPGNTEIPEGYAKRAVTEVSWFAARAYCNAQGGRLPTLDEWEYASSQYLQQQQMSDQDYAQMLFGRHSNPTAYSQQPLDVNSKELAHMHNRVNEWVEDFQLMLTSGDNNDILSSSCGDSARFMADFGDASYATFFRYQSRSNYRAQSTTSTLGFRCAYDME